MCKPGSISSGYSVIFQVRMILKRTIGDRYLDNLKSSSEHEEDPKRFAETGDDFCSGYEKLVTNETII